MIKTLIILLIFTPLIMSILLMSPILRNEETLQRKSAKIFSIIHLLISAAALIMFDFSNPEFKYEAIFNWIPPLGINAVFRIDSFSILLCVLASFIFLISVFISEGMIKNSYRLYYSLIFLLQTSVLGVFCTDDMFVFFLFWELELIPMYLLLLKWGSGNKRKTAMKFLLYTFFGSLFLLFGFLIIYFFNFISNGLLTADLAGIDLYNAPYTFKLILFIMLFIGFGVKLPVFPLHSWLPDAHAQAPAPVSILLSALLIKMGAFGILKFNFILLEDVFTNTAPIIMLMGVINLIYASLCAIAQKDIKNIIAFSGIAHMGIFLTGLSSLNKTGITGAMFEIFSHALITSGLFIIAGIIYIKCGTKNILRIQGLGERMPRLMLISVPIVLSAAGVPLLCGFIAEFLSFSGAFMLETAGKLNSQIMITIALTSIILCSIYILKIFHGVFFGKLYEKYKKIKDININQLTILSVLAIYIIFFGIFPSLLTDIFTRYITGVLQ